jgi:hypothetical protein
VAPAHDVLPGLDPDDGIVLRGPERAEPGYWAGCPSVVADGDRWLMTYRQRRPRGAERERGWRCAVAVSDDGISFSDVWSVTKDELSTSSMERFAVAPLPDGGGYRLLLSYVDPVDNRWRIDSVTAADPAQFDVAARRPVLTAASTATEGVKDPWLFEYEHVTYLFASFAAPSASVDAQAHATGDIYNVGATTHPTGVATSVDGETFTWQGEALGVGAGWDRYQARLNTVMPVAGGFLGVYDGSASHAENYEERCGLARSVDLRNWSSATPDEPWTESAHATGSVRYVDLVLRDGDWWAYYEMTRDDGAHELRAARLRPPLLGRQ